MDTASQLASLESWSGRSFVDRVGHLGLRAGAVKTLQINLGRRCNQACNHCHVDASPIRQEAMDPEIANKCIGLLDRCPEIETIDLTGGAPEMHDAFRPLVLAARERGKRVIDRCNLTILSEPGYEWVSGFLSQNEVEVIASLPCYTKENVDSQRGKGAFERSLSGLRLLNKLGYGDRLPLHLVYNPAGPVLPGSQAALEADYRRILGDFGVHFTSLFTLANMPVNRFMDQLLRTNRFGTYMSELADHFNPETLNGIMCRSQISVSWDGRMFDCDFNQMLEITADLQDGLESVGEDDLSNRHIRFANHCYGCTAGHGSSCNGSLT